MKKIFVFIILAAIFCFVINADNYDLNDCDDAKTKDICVNQTAANTTLDCCLITFSFEEGEDSTNCYGVYKKKASDVEKELLDIPRGSSHTKPTKVDIQCSSSMLTGSFLLIALIVLLL